MPGQKKEPKPKRPIGRPSILNDELMDKIMQLVEKGYSLRQIEKIEGFPPSGTMVRWMSEKPEFRARFARAKEIFAEHEFERMHEIADNCGLSNEEISKAKLQIDTRKWTLARLYPKKYSEKLLQEISGPDGGVIESAFKVQFVRPKDGSKD